MTGSLFGFHVCVNLGSDPLKSTSGTSKPALAKKASERTYMRYSRNISERSSVPVPISAFPRSPAYRYFFSVTANIQGSETEGAAAFTRVSLPFTPVSNASFDTGGDPGTHRIRNKSGDSIG